MIFAFLGYFCAAVVNIFDKYVLSNRHIPSSLFIFYSTAPALLFAVGIPWTQFPFGYTWFAVAGAAASFFVGLALLYKGYEASEISHVGPLVGGVLPLVVFLLGSLALAEHLMPRQLVALLLISLGSLVISFEKSRNHRGWHQGMLWGVGAGTSLAVFQVLSKFVYTTLGFWSGLVWTSAFVGIGGILFLFVPAVRQSFGHKSPKQSKLKLVVVDKLLGAGGVLFIQYAVAHNSVTLVNALNGIQYAFLVILVAVLSKFFPKIFKEDYERGELLQEGIAVLLIGLGVAGVLL